MTEAPFLVMTVAHHRDQEFYDLGRVTHETTTDKLFESIPDTPCPSDDNGATHPDMCIIIDYWPDEQTGISTDKEITRELANTLLEGRFDELLEAAQAELVGVYAAMEARSA